jgi:chemotaxis methyl-accepting protein methylase
MGRDADRCWFAGLWRTLALQVESNAKYRHVVFEGRKAPGGYGAAFKAPSKHVSSRPEIKPEVAPVGADWDFVNWLLERVGLEKSRYRWRPLERRIAACLRALRADSPVQARQILERKPELVPTALNALLIGVTGFFRDAEVFEYLRQRVLPELSDRQLKVWSVACSDGSELYSLAMLLADLGYGCGRLLGTDCRAQAVEGAREGWFSEAAVQSLSAQQGDRYLLREGSGFRIVPAIRDRIQWETADAFTRDTGELWDIILCRNLTIYLASDSADELWKKLAKSLAEGGVIVTGKSERLPPITGLARVGPCVYRRRGG